MDPLRIAVRAGFAYVFMLTMVRLTGKRTVRQASALDFVLALVVGDLVDDVLWAEVSISTFITAVSSFVALSIASAASFRRY